MLGLVFMSYRIFDVDLVGCRAYCVQSFGLILGCC